MSYTTPCKGKKFNCAKYDILQSDTVEKPLIHRHM